MTRHTPKLASTSASADTPDDAAALGAQYQRQSAWRDWDQVLETLPPLQDATVLDLGCAVGDQAALLASRGATVIGIDGNEALLAEARRRDIPRARFLHGDLRALHEIGLQSAGGFDGVWASFSPAYFVDFGPVLQQWVQQLRPDGWIALVEINDLFAHEPLSARTRATLDAFAQDALLHRRYDFAMGGKLRDYLERAELQILHDRVLRDLEFSFQGPATAGVLRAWQERWQRMQLLRRFCGNELAIIEREFLEALELPAHRSASSVHCVVAGKPDRPDGLPPATSDGPPP